MHSILYIIAAYGTGVCRLCLTWSACLALIFWQMMTSAPPSDCSVLYAYDTNTYRETDRQTDLAYGCNSASSDFIVFARCRKKSPSVWVSVSPSSQSTLALVSGSNRYPDHDNCSCKVDFFLQTKMSIRHPTIILKFVVKVIGSQLRLFSILIFMTRIIYEWLVQA